MSSFSFHLHVNNDLSIQSNHDYNAKRHESFLEDALPHTTRTAQSGKYDLPNDCVPIICQEVGDCEFTCSILHKQSLKKVSPTIELTIN